MSINLRLDEIAEAVDEAGRLALIELGERGQVWLERHAPEVSGFYKRSVFLDVRPDGDVLLIVAAKYAKALEARRGIFNRMIKEVLNPGEVRKVIAAHVESALARFPRVRG